MIVLVIAFVSGVILLQWQPELPNLHFLWLFPLLLTGCFRYRSIRIPGAFLLGFLWAAFNAYLGLQVSLAPELYSRNLTVTGTVSSLPRKHDHHLSFEFSVDELSDRKRTYPSPGVVRLNWYREPDEITAGERWRLRVRLKPAHGFMNPAGFDYEGWLFHQGIRAKGYVRDHPSNQRLGEGGYRFAIQRMRQWIRSLIESQLSQGRATSLVLALVIGDRGRIPAADWNLFRTTGTNHLVAISGLHIGIVGGLAFYLTGFGWRRLPWLVLRIAAPKAAASAAVAAGICYAALAGFSLPTQRALIMLTMVAAGVLLQAEFRALRSLALAMLIVVLLDPAAVLSAGFWLSFLAVAVIFSGTGHRVGKRSLLFSWFGIQWLIALGLAPVLLIWQQQLPLIAPLANMLAIPLFSLLIIPLSLGGTLLSIIWVDGGLIPLTMADWLLDMSRTLLAQIARFPLRIGPPPAMPGYLWAAAGSGVLLLLLPRAVPVRIPGLILLLPLFLDPPHPRLAQEAYRFTLLDVGQGMAAVVQTRNHTLVYDAGPGFSEDFNAGSSVLLPFLQWRGINLIDRLVLSNGDSDHQGGLIGLIGEIPIKEVLSGEPDRIRRMDASPCAAGRSWSWDGVRFSFLHPGTGRSWSGNNASCVLLVESRAGRLLITGDIESAAEKSLLACCRETLATQLVTMPHHGSGTSSTPDFLRAVDADYVLASTGYLNRYGFPKGEVVSRWEMQGSLVLDTALTGAIEFVLDPRLGMIGPERHRLSTRRYWTHLPSVNRVEN